MLKYDYKTTPYAHQKSVLEKSWNSEYWGLFMEMGTGKTKVAIDTMAALHLAGKLKAALILAPKGVYDNWVKGEIPAHLPEKIRRRILRWEPKSSKAYVEELSSLIDGQFDGIKILVMNIEAMSTDKGTKVAEMFLKKNPVNIMIVDESTTIKNRTAARTKAVIRVGRTFARYRRLLTGSPVTKNPMDLYSQCMFLDDKALGFASYFSFQNRYAHVVRRTMGHRSFQEIVGYQRLDELSKKLSKFSSRILKEECLDLPPKTYMRRDVALTPEQDSAYLQMKKLALAQLSSGELATTASVLTQIMRLQQICCGFLTDDDGKQHLLPNNRLSELLDVIDEIDGKAIIWATWTSDLLRITEALRKRYGPESAATYYGETPQDQRQATIQRFQDPNNPLRIFVAQPKTGGYGITLTAANTVIYYSNSYDLEIRLQSEDRAHRIGQTGTVNYVDLVSPGTIDEKILKALREKISLANEVLGDKARDWLS